MKPVLTVPASYLGFSRRRLRPSLRGSCKKPAAGAGVKAKKLEPRAHSASRLSLGKCNENTPAICAGVKAKEKLEPRARSASRLSLGRCNENIPAICAGR